MACPAAGITSPHAPRHQTEARVLTDAIRERGHYVVQLRVRLEKTGRTGDPLYPVVKAAAEAMHTLWVHLHYRGCEVDRPPPAAGRSEAADVNTGGSPSPE